MGSNRDHTDLEDFMVKVDIIETKASPGETRKTPKSPNLNSRTLTVGLDPSKLFEQFEREERELEQQSRGILEPMSKSPNLVMRNKQHRHLVEMKRHSYCAGQFSGAFGQSVRISKVQIVQLLLMLCYYFHIVFFENGLILG